MAPGRLQGVADHGAAQAAAAGGGGDPEVDDLPGIPPGDLGQEQHGRGLRLAGEPPQLPAPGHEQPGRPVAGEDVLDPRAPSSSGMSRLPT